MQGGDPSPVHVARKLHCSPTHCLPAFFWNADLKKPVVQRLIAILGGRGVQFESTQKDLPSLCAPTVIMPLLSFSCLLRMPLLHPFACTCSLALRLPMSGNIRMVCCVSPLVHLAQHSDNSQPDASKEKLEKFQMPGICRNQLLLLLQMEHWVCRNLKCFLNLLDTQDFNFVS